MLHNHVFHSFSMLFLPFPFSLILHTVALQHKPVLQDLQHDICSQPQKLQKCSGCIFRIKEFAESMQNLKWRLMAILTVSHAERGLREMRLMPSEDRPYFSKICVQCYFSKTPAAQKKTINIINVYPTV